ncbi:hypothetical protein [Nannocystis exedens]|uniref:hypothetical protein n=1 Tax=Nannocystis exedens TaxID=54 RepID=UPI001160E273|nr:hypothetical protein [Nannocystis exedens]
MKFNFPTDQVLGGVVGLLALVEGALLLHVLVDDGVDDGRDLACPQPVERRGIGAASDRLSSW